MSVKWVASFDSEAEIEPMRRLLVAAGFKCKIPEKQSGQHKKAYFEQREYINKSSNACSVGQSAV
jgi:hypothetical protein